MRVQRGTVPALRLPLVEEFAHALAEREHSDWILVEVITDDGTHGYVVGPPPDDVTGESVDASIDHLAEVLWPHVRGLDLPRPLDPGAGLDALRTLTDSFPSSAHGAGDRSSPRSPFVARWNSR